MKLNFSELRDSNPEQMEDAIRGKRVVLGFDGFIDSIVRPVRSGNCVENPAYFETMRSFSEFIAARQGLSGSLELDTITEKIGGNMPNTAVSMKRMGASVTGIGAMGYPVSHPLFSQAFKPGEMVSVADPGTCISFEFNDGKLMCAQNRSINQLDWSTLRRRADGARLSELYAKCDMMVFSNWSEMPHGHGIWEGFMGQCCQTSPEKKLALFDLSDCSRKKPEQIRAVMELIRDFSRKSNVLISLNENEGAIVCSALFGVNLAGEAEGVRLAEFLRCKAVVFHQLDKTISFTQDGLYCVDNHVIPRPLISTGGGDSFNAGFCCGLLAGLDIPKATVFGSLSGSYFVEHAKCATIGQILRYAEQLSAHSK